MRPRADREPAGRERVCVAHRWCWWMVVGAAVDSDNTRTDPILG